MFLDGLSYEMGIYFDAGVGTNFQFFYPINHSDADHSIGDNSTGQGADEESNGANYPTLIGSKNLPQDSWNMDFFDSGAFPFDVNVDGLYDIYLLARDCQGGEVSRVDIQVIGGNGAVEVAEAGILTVLGLCLAGLALMRRRQHA